MVDVTVADLRERSCVGDGLLVAMAYSIAVCSNIACVSELILCVALFCVGFQLSTGGMIPLLGVYTGVGGLEKSPPVYR